MIGLKCEVFRFWVFIVSVVSPIVESGSDIRSLNYVVDCSACYSLPVQNLDSYSCKVRCELNGGCLSKILSLTFCKKSAHFWLVHQMFIMVYYATFSIVSWTENSECSLKQFSWTTIINQFTGQSELRVLPVGWLRECLPVDHTQWTIAMYSG